MKGRSFESIVGSTATRLVSNKQIPVVPFSLIGLASGTRKSTKKNIKIAQHWVERPVILILLRGLWVQ
jgi:hypothetical protein